MFLPIFFFSFTSCLPCLKDFFVRRCFFVALSQVPYNNKMAELAQIFFF